MANSHSLNDLLAFLAHASERGLMPAATAQALAVACRNVFGVLSDEEREHLPLDDLDGIITRFSNKRAKDFNPSSLKTYGLRVRRAVEQLLRWEASPADFSVKTRSTSAARARGARRRTRPPGGSGSSRGDGTYSSARPGRNRIPYGISDSARTCTHDRKRSIRPISCRGGPSGAVCQNAGLRIATPPNIVFPNPLSGATLADSSDPEKR